MNNFCRCIEAVNTGDLNILTDSLPRVDVRMAVSITLAAIKRDRFRLMGCLLKKLVRERAFEVMNDKLVRERAFGFFFFFEE